VTKRGEAYRDRVFSALGDLRTDIDALEGLVPTTLWPVPTYADLLYMI
jgi:glutamine synthetase